MRKDSDMLGEVLLPDDVYYGAQTYRAIRLFTGSKETIAQFPSFVCASAGIKKAAATVHRDIGLLAQDKFQAIAQACDEVIEGKFDSQLPLDMLSGNDFAPINMNFNEVIACRANEILTGQKGFDAISPNNHVNMGQSTCDASYNAVRFALYFELEKVIAAIKQLRDVYQAKVEEVQGSIKLSHTCLQDAAPVTLSQFYSASVTFLDRQLAYLSNEQEVCLEHSIGYTVIGTGLGSFHGFHERIDDALNKIFGFECKQVDNPFYSLQYADLYLRISALLQATMTGVSKMARDIRLMCSGPVGGFNEITIAAVQNGSSFFPGKVNPSLAELVNIACYQICGYHVSITMGVEAGEVDITPWYPVFAVNLFNSCSLIYNTVPAFAEKCVATIRPNESENAYKANRSMGIAPVVSALLGYKKATEVAAYAKQRNLTVCDAVVEMDLMPRDTAEKLLDPAILTDIKVSSKLLYDHAEKAIN